VWLKKIPSLAPGQSTCKEIGPHLGVTFPYVRMERGFGGFLGRGTEIFSLKCNTVGAIFPSPAEFYEIRAGQFFTTLTMFIENTFNIYFFK